MRLICALFSPGDSASRARRFSGSKSDAIVAIGVGRHLFLMVCRSLMPLTHMRAHSAATVLSVSSER